MRAVQKTFAEEFERVLVESDTSVGRLARLSGISKRTLENWLYGNTLRPRNVDQILQVARVLHLPAMDIDKLLLSAGHPSLTRLRQKKQLQPDILLAWQLPPDTQKGQKHSALEHAQLLLRQMPWNEEAHREVMELLALNGRRSEALKQFEICKKALREELGVEPSAETLALYERIRRTTRFSKNNIPAIVTPLIGREQELATISSMLADPDIRLVTITGLGGMGKTRLALDLAWRHTEGQFQDGVTFVQLAGLESTDHIIQSIAQALHMPLTATDENTIRQQLLDYLKPKQMLLVLDNCEHLLDGMPIVADILKASPEVQILATSRERLRLLSEYLLPLQGLPYDDTHANHPAARLVQETAQRLNPDFEITDLNAPHVNHLCSMVDGMPLALELAASWMDTMPVDKIVTQVDCSLDFLAADLHDIAPRHRSLRALSESIWAHLEPQTQQVFAALSAFRGSFSADAATEVSGATPKILEYLVLHSLLKHDIERDRYQLHEILRQFAAEQLAGEPDLEQAVTQRHFVTYNDLAQQGGTALRGGNQSQWMARLELETNNIRQAIDWAINNDIELAARMVVSLHIYWQTSGQVLEAMQQYERILPYKEDLSPQIWPWLLVVAAEMMFNLGRTQESIALETKALPWFLDQADEEGLAFIYLLWSTTARRFSEDINTSIQFAEAGLKHALTPGTDTYYASLLLESLSDSLTRSGRFAEAEARIKQGFQLCVERDDLMTTNYLLAQMSMLNSMQGQHMEARRYVEECLKISRQLNIVQAELIALDNLGIIDYATGNLDQAEEFIADGIALAREMNFHYYLAALDIVMGDILMAKNANQEAFPFFREALALFTEMDHQFRIPEIIERLADWTWRTNASRDNKKSVKPVRWMACAIARLEATGHIQPPLEIARRTRIRSELETELGEKEVARAWAEGEQLSVEEALEEIYRALPLSPG